MSKNKAWSPAHIKVLEEELQTILHQSGEGISQNCLAVETLAKLLGRTNMAVALKARTLALKKGLIMTRKQAQERQQSAMMVVVPLEKLYGKVDFETFMTLINE
jgi:hypothetical protein